MRTLTLKTFRSLARIRWRALAVALTVACGVGVFAGIDMAGRSLVNTTDRLLGRMRFADLEVQFLPEDVANLPDLTGIAGVSAVERRLILPGTVFVGGGQRLAGILVFLETPRPAINALELLDGRPIQAGDFESAVIERSLALYQGVRVGDRIRVQVGARSYESRVDGIALSPEYLTTTANPDYVIPEKGTLGVVFADLARVSDALGFTMVNGLLFRFEPGADRRAVRERVLARLSGLNLERVTPREDHFVWRHLQMDLDAFGIYTPTIVVILGALAFVLTLLTMNRLVLDQRKEIGALLALGYGNGQVLRAYLAAGALVGIAGGVLGVGLAFLFRNLFGDTYADAHGLPAVLYVTTADALGLGLVGGALIPVLATAVPVLRMLRLTPHAIIRDPMRTDLPSMRWSRWPGLRLGALPMPVRFGLRSMFRRPGRTLATIVAVACSLGVSIAYMVAFRSAFDTLAIVAADERWDMAVDFLYPVFLEDVEPLRARSGVIALEPYMRRFAEVGAGGRYEGATIFGIHPQTRMRSPNLRAGRFLGDDATGVVLTHDLARRLGVGVGESVSVRVRHGEEHRFHVTGISGEITPAQVVMSFRQAQVITGFKDEATGVYVDTSGPTPALESTLASLAYVGTITKKGDIVAAYARLMSEMMRIVYLATAVSIFVAALFVFMSVNLSVTERQAEFAMFQCLGYDRWRVRGMILTQALGEGLLAAVASVPIGIALALLLNARMGQAWFDVITVFHPGDIATILVAAIGLMPLAASPSLRVLASLNIVDALRTRAFE